MIRSIIVIALMSVASFPVTADVAKGKALHQESCVQCHANRFGGDGAAIYTRPNRKVNDIKRLEGQVAFCSNMVGAQWFDDEIKSVSNYLNQEYYHIK